MKKLLFVLCAVSLFNTYLTITYNKETNDRINELEVKVGKTAKVTATMYNAVVSQCDDDPLITAGMYKIVPDKASEHKWIAVSRNLLKRWNGIFSYGDKVLIKGAGHKDGVYTIVDTMNKRYVNRIDFLETKGVPKYKFEGVTITKINS